MNIIPFNFKNHNIRVILGENGEPLFIAKDVTEILGYANDSQAIDDNCNKSGVSVRYIPILSNNYKLITEGNLYRLILKSSKPEAEQFESFVCDDVLPSIRKTGSYSVKPLSLEEMTLQVIEGQQNKILQLENKIEADKPLTSFGKAISQSIGTCMVGDWIKAINDSGDIKIGRNKAFGWLREQKYLMKNNMPRQKYVDSGLFEVKESLVITGTRTFPAFTTLLTGKGQMVLAEKLKAAL